MHPTDTGKALACQASGTTETRMYKSQLAKQFALCHWKDFVLMFSFNEWRFIAHAVGITSLHHKCMVHLF